MAERPRAASAPALRSKYSPEQIRSFRHLWQQLHLIAAFAANACLAQDNLLAVMRAIALALRRVCARCAHHFETRIVQLAAAAPEEIERRMYELHSELSSTPSGQTPTFEAVQAVYRRKARCLLTQFLVSNAQHGP